MDDRIRQAYDSERDFSEKAVRAGCYSPFVSLHFNTRGDAVACCQNQSYVLGNVAQDRLDDIWTGERIRAMRESLVDYNFEGGCEFCGWLIAAGDYGGAMTRMFEHFRVDGMQPEFPRHMEFALSNTCNFACVQCNGESSSKIRAERECLPPLSSPYGDRFFDELRRYLPHLERANFYGGEPFLAQETFRIWDMLIEDGLTPLCQIITNGSQWNSKVERVLEALPVTVDFSLDAITSKEKLESIRVHADFDMLMTNMRRFREYTRARGTPMQINYSWMRNNWEELGPILLLCEEQEFEIDVIRVHHPPAFSLFSLPADEILRIADKMEAQSDTVLPHLKRLRHVWVDAIKSLRENASDAQEERYREVGRVVKELRHGHLQSAQESSEQGRWEDAIEAAQKVPETNYDYFHCLLIQAHAYRRLGQFDAAEETLELALSLAQRSPPTWVERAWLRLEQGRHADGMSDARKALEYAERAGNENQIFNAGHVLAQLLLSAEDIDQAIEVVTERKDVVAGLACARWLSDRQRPDEALEMLARLATMNPSDDQKVEGLHLAAILHRVRRELEAAQGAVVTGLELSPDHPGLHLEAAWLAAESDRHADGLEYAQRAMELAGEGETEMAIWVGQCLGHLHAHVGNYAAALPFLERHATTHPQDAGTREKLDQCRAALASGS